MFKRISLTLKMLLITMIVGIFAWSFLDPIQSRTIKNVFHHQLSAKLAEDANKNLMLFDRYVQIFRQNVRLIVLQKQFYDYVREANKKEWALDPDGQGHIKSYSYYTEFPRASSAQNSRDRLKAYLYYMESPQWLQDISVLRSYPSFSYALLTDGRGRVREIYKNIAEAPPPSLLEPAHLLQQLRHNQSLLTDIGGVLYLVTAESLYSPDRKPLATLLLAAPVDNKFLSESQDKDNIVAFAGGDSRGIFASNRGDLLPAGTPLESLKDRYLYSGKSFYNYGASGLKMEIITLIPREPYELLSKSILGKERGNRIITALLLILSFSLIMIWITKRIQKLTGRVLDFSEKSLNVRKKYSSPEGDELKVLDECFRTLTGEIAASHESLRSQAETLQKERDRAQNYLDIAGTIILTLNSEGRVTLINRKGSSLLGYREEEIVGKDWFDNFIPERMRHEIREVFGKIMSGEGGFPAYYENPVLAGAGGERLVAWHNTALKDEGGRITGILSSGEDITEHKQLERSLIGIEERERRRIGQDLHDGLGQLLTGIAFQVRGLGRKLEKNYFADAESAAEISVLVDDAKKQVSRISKGLYPVEMDREGLMTALEELAVYTRKAFEIPCDFVCREPVSILNKTAVLQLYRIAQEAVTNAVKHGRPGRVEISLSGARGKILMTVKDDGTGIPGVSGRITGGMGLKIMGYRANLINAMLDIRQDTGGGTTVTCIFSDTGEEPEQER
ncbi:MAG: PAS domain-containing sensor histidine kinase [Nitrospiraceae bacterium]|nr:MAG: PAS domain-containing sensor histidine kinase [Nitrospiraceae bacterium]